VEPNRNFINKIWNASRLVITSIEKVNAGPTAEPAWTLADSWIWARLQELVRDVERLFQSYQYGEAGRQIYDFFWSEFADWYLEIAKLQLNEGGDCTYYTAYGMLRVLDICLRLLHPFIPFVTEELWGNLRKALRSTPLAATAAGWPEALIIAPFPEPQPVEGWEKDCLADFSLVQESIRSIRNIRAEKGVKPGRLIPAVLSAGEKTGIFLQQKHIIAALAQLEADKFTITSSLPAKKENDIVLAIGMVEIHLPLEGLVDVDEERTRLSGALVDAEKQVERLEKLLASSFAERAPAEIVQKEREKLASYQETMSKLRTQLETLA
jgi:valyl-tRNA synthetase